MQQQQHQLQSTFKVLCQKCFILVDFIPNDKTQKKLQINEDDKKKEEEEKEAYIHSGK